MTLHLQVHLQEEEVLEEGKDLPIRARVRLQRDLATGEVWWQRTVSRTLQEEMVEEAIHPLGDAAVEDTEVQGTQSVLVRAMFFNLG